MKLGFFLTFNCVRRGHQGETMDYTAQMGPEGQILAVTLAIMSLAEKRPDADIVVAMPGLVLDETVKAAVETLEHHEADSDPLLVAGYHEESVVAERFTRETFFKAYDVGPSANVILQGHARHTGEQASWVADQVEKFDAESVALYVPAFHMPRNYLTVLEAFRRKGMMVSIIPALTPILLYSEVVLDPKTGERNQTQLDRMQHEAMGLINYAKPKGDGSPGDVATAAYFFNEYLPWLRRKGLLI